jgi:sugar lactone lactonase YvrE
MHAMAALEQHVGKSRVAFRLPERDLITEGIAYDPKSGDFFVSSVHKRKVLRVTPDGRSSDFLKAGQDGLLGVTGLWVDSARRALWLSTAWAPMVADLRPEEKDTSFLMEYDLGSGKLRRKLAPPSGVSGANLSDFGVGPDGTLIVSDPFSGRMYVLPPRAEGLQVLVEKGILASPQGVAWSPDGSAVFVADYSQGIARIDPKTGAVALLPAPADTALSGIDGLVWARGSLVGIQNGVTPHKLLRLELAPDASRITRASVLERSNPEFEEPTLAVVAGSDLFYVAASQYSRVRKDGSLDLDKMKPPVVLRLPIDW